MFESDNTTYSLPDDEKVEILRAFRCNPWFGRVSVRPESEGPILYERSATRVDGEPTIEIPHEDPYLVDKGDAPEGARLEITFEQLLEDYGCRAETKDGFTYITVIESEHKPKPAGDI